MIVQFPVAHHDELLLSILGRFVNRQGIKDDKIALDLLFGSRTVVPSALLQGHIKSLLKQVGHIWNTDARSIVDNHTLLPLFRPFIPRDRYDQLEVDLSSAINPSMLRTGINASILSWPTTFKVCPVCWHQQRQRYGYSFWQRLFQCPGVECCPVHRCLIVDTGVCMQSIRRHQIVGVQQVGNSSLVMGEAAGTTKIKLARMTQEILTVRLKCPAITQWSSYYKYLAQRQGYQKHKGIDHDSIRKSIVDFWGESWLVSNGLALKNESNWLVMMFRKHRKPFTYLQHMACWLAMKPGAQSVSEVINEVLQFSREPLRKAVSFRAIQNPKTNEYRQGWLCQISKFSSLKEIRSRKEGARLYSWLFRFDYKWLQAHKPPKLLRVAQRRVDWRARDLKLVRQLLALEKSHLFELGGPRRSQTWFGRQLNCKSLLEKKLYLLPLCRAFLIRYSESIEEYQTRRLARTMASLFQKGLQGLAIYEIERKSGLSKERCFAPARQILRYDIPTWKSIKAFPDRCQA